MAEAPQVEGRPHELTRERYVAKDGYIDVTDAPGLGFTIDEKTVAKYRVS